MSLAAQFAVHRPRQLTEVDLTAERGEVIGLIGPNGAGKTTTLRALAGLLPITRGKITLDGTVLADGRHQLPAHHRSVGFVFQDHLLFPHLTATDNVAFGLRARGAGKTAAREVAANWLRRLDVVALADRRPREMSGGQAQRVAIARALAGEPALLLLDEPTAALDATAAMSLRTALRDHLRALSAVSILVTHTALDALVVADRLVVMDGGVIVQSGSPAEVAARPRTQHVASLVGLNLLRGTAVEGAVRLTDGMEVVAAERLSGRAFAAFSPRSVSLFADRPSGSPRNVWPGKVTSLAPHGDAIRVQIAAAMPLLADITPAALATLRLGPGSPVWASVKATEVTVYPA